MMKRYDYIAEVKELIRAMEALKEELLQELDEEPYIKDGDIYYFMNNMGDAIPRRNSRRSGNDLKKLEFGNGSKSLGYIKETARMVKMMQRLRLFLEMEGYKDWEPDWKDTNEEKWSIRYFHKGERWREYYDVLVQHQGTVYFPSQKLTKKAIEEVVKPLEREWAE